MTDKNGIRLLNEKLLSDDWGTLTKHAFDLKRQSGEWQHQTREVYDRGNGATCLLYDPEFDCVLLTRQFRLPAYLNGGVMSLIEAPAGLLDGAGAAERMREELIEETGYQIETLEHLYDLYMSPGSVTEFLAFFVGIYARDSRAFEGGGKFDEGEDIEVMHVELDRALDMIKTGEIRDGKTVILLQHLASNRPVANRTAGGA